MCNSQDAAASANKYSSSLLQVLPEVIVEEILLRLAVKPLFKFKCVSKQYESIISEPQFAKRYMRQSHFPPEKPCSLGISRLLLLSYTGLMYKDCSSKKFEEACHGNEGNELSIPVSQVSLPNDERGEILASSNDLIVFSHQPEGNRLCRVKLYVYNPLTKQGVWIPKSKLNKLSKVGVGFATRQATMSLLLTYKIVIIQRPQEIDLPEKVNISAEIFCSETGSWTWWELKDCLKEVFLWGIAEEGFSYKGVLHWLCSYTGVLVTYDPYNSPDRLGCISLPKKRYPGSNHKGLIFPGDNGVLKYSELGNIKPGVQKMFVWRLVDGNWCPESMFDFPFVRGFSKTLMVCPNPWDPDTMCRAGLIDTKLTVMNVRTRRSRVVDVFDETKGPIPSPYSKYDLMWNLCPLDPCPWSSPFYVDIGLDCAAPSQSQLPLELAKISL